ncbi:hypothetical protein ISF_05014 [Cordyceps fumosorosea ARSEF 2679]|uniref:Cell wall galactomannoprotein n=1 Tax=Cordyceps fumosorosea (strain ARSEF 2679) TaxID=1081104 RepID=A0A167VZ37_CORFA|nr:hypothetical protein ISF_05014 [Cordyceps fumosorosea ARSEF 2679]OAA63138.1 hypothetical protein ISF_05014 [Cordyceps fumosorosea ARSEF 2679]
MRFSASLIALVGVAMAAPAIVPTGVAAPVTGLLGSTDLVSELTGVTDEVEKGSLGADDLEQKLDAILGSSLVKVESALNQPLAQKLLALVQGGLPPQVVQAVGQGIALVEQGVAIQTVDAYVRGMTEGQVKSLGGALGVSDIQKVLQG